MSTTWRWPIRRSHRVAQRFGPFTVVGGAGDFDAEGRIVHAGDLLAQIDGALDNVRVALALEGSTLDDVVRLKAFYRGDGARDEWEVIARLLRPFETLPHPAVTANPVPLQPFAGQEVQVQALAVTGWRRAGPARAVTRRVPAARTGLFRVPHVTQGLRAGELIAVAGQSAADEDGRVLAPDDGIQQTRIVMARLEHTLRELGASLQDSIKKEGYYFGTTVEGWAAMARERATFFREPGPVATVVPCHALHPPGAVTKVEVLAMRAARDKYIPREDRWPESVWDWPIPVPYRQGLRLRGAIWIGGQVPLERSTTTWRLAHVGDLKAQTRHTMGYLEDIVRAFGRAPADIRWLTCYFASKGTPGESESFLDWVADSFPGELPPITLVPQPMMHTPEVGLEIWGVAEG
ncbi:MAG: RidA family protein [Alphaproteobacteria bacterium]